MIEYIINNIWFCLLASGVAIFLTLKNFKQHTKQCITDRRKKSNRITFVIVMILGTFTVISFILFLIFRNWFLSNLGSGLTENIAEYNILAFNLTRFFSIFTVLFAFIRLLMFYQITKKQE